MTVQRVDEAEVLRRLDDLLAVLDRAILLATNRDDLEGGEDDRGE